MPPLSASRSTVLRSVAARVVPEAVELDAEGWQRFMDLVNHTLDSRPPQVQRQFGVFLTLLNYLPFARYGRPFTRLGPHRQDAVLRWLQDFPVQLLRSALWGLKTLIYLGFYGQVENWSRIDYSPSHRGNERLHA